MHPMAEVDNQQAYGRWTNIFLEIATRAIRRVHLEHQAWSIGNQLLERDRDPEYANFGRGIELADERAVCAAISQEFVYCRLASGVWARGTEWHFYHLSREVDWASATSQVNSATATCCEGRRTIDLIVQRFLAASPAQTPTPAGRPVLIEAGIDIQAQRY